MITVLNGDIRSGKTTTLLNWSKEHHCAGFLTPDHAGLRAIYNIAGSETIPFQVADNVTAPSLQIGRFAFLLSGFDMCYNIVAHGIAQHYATIIIDEIGPLELQGLGHDRLVRDFIQEASPIHWIVVVRTQLREKVVEHYAWKNVEFAEITNFQP